MPTPSGCGSRSWTTTHCGSPPMPVSLRPISPSRQIPQAETKTFKPDIYIGTFAGTLEAFGGPFVNGHFGLSTRATPVRIVTPRAHPITFGAVVGAVTF